MPDDSKGPKLLTLEERQLWNELGYLHLRSVLSEHEVTHFMQSVLELREQLAGKEKDTQASFVGLAGNSRDLNITQIISLSSSFDPLIDHPRIFGKILGLMGPYIQVTGTEVLFRYPDQNILLRLHTDGGPSLRRIFPHPASLVLHLKVQFFLTDLSTPDRGNMMVVPRSHLVPFPEVEHKLKETGSEAQQIRAAPGDAVIFPWSLWHGVGPNRSSENRISLIIRFAQMWCRPVDYERLEQNILARMPERRRRLFGDLGETQQQSDFYHQGSDDHLRIVFGSEWSHYPECADYFHAEPFFRELYAAPQVPAAASDDDQGAL